MLLKVLAWNFLSLQQAAISLQQKYIEHLKQKKKNYTI